MNKSVIYFLFSVLLAGCAINIESYKKQSPAFSMQEFFNGKLCVWGVVRKRSSQVNRKFIADIIATLDGNKLVLDEKFLFDDGEEQTRVWSFVESNGSWSGTAADVVGTASAEIAGDTLHLTYQLKVTVEEDEYIIDMDDWLHQIDDRVLMGSTQMTKWGIDMGSIDIVIQRQSNRVHSCIAKV